MADTVEMSRVCVEGLNRIGMAEFSVSERPERMAYVARVLRLLDDDPDVFPRGKWATIQSIEAQVDACAAVVARGCLHWEEKARG